MYLADENFPRASIRLLRTAGLDVAAIIEESPGATDEAILKRAERDYQIILTFDRDYGELLFHRRLGRPRGVIYFRYDPVAPEEPGKHLLYLLTIPYLQLTDKFTVVDRERVRQRSL